MGENLADLAVGLQHADSRTNGAMGRLYAANWEQPDRARNHRWRERLAAGLLALAHRLAPEAYERQFEPSTGLAQAGPDAVAAPG